MNNSHLLINHKKNIPIMAIFVIFYGVVVLKSAWLTEDAYITFRTVDNFIHGYGLTWNTVERVQAYTHPLWMFLISAAYFFTHEIFFTVIFISVMISLMVTILLTFKLNQSLMAGILAIGFMVSSKAFIDFSTSGLENPLSHLVIVLFVWLYWRFEPTPRWLYHLSVLTALGTLTRLDLGLAFLPMLVHAMWQIGLKPSFRLVPLGFIPFIVWELFSLFYYGSLVPNTAYAKLNNGISQAELAQQGLYYLLSSLDLDPVTLLITISGLLLPVITRRWSQLPLAIGGWLYLAYVVSIGGDFMNGRFLTIPFLIAVMLIIEIDWSGLPEPSWLAVFLGTLLLGITSPYPPLLSNSSYGLGRTDWNLIDERGVADERGYYYQYSGLFRSNRGMVLPEANKMAIKGLRIQAEKQPVVEWNSIGYLGFYVGPNVYVIDGYGLADPLLARLPPPTYESVSEDFTNPFTRIHNQGWRPGHFLRQTPAGYFDTLFYHENRIANKNLSVFYDKLSFVIRGPLFNFNRLKEIWYLNTGHYDYLLQDYPVMYKLNLPLADKEALWHNPYDISEYAGIHLNLDKQYHANHLEITLKGGLNYLPTDLETNQRRYKIIYLRDSLVVGLGILEIPILGDQEITHQIVVPGEVVTRGFNNIKLFPLVGNRFTHIIYSLKNIAAVNE